MFQLMRRSLNLFSNMKMLSNTWVSIIHGDHQLVLLIVTQLAEAMKYASDHTFSGSVTISKELRLKRSRQNYLRLILKGVSKIIC